jgi:cell fate regulator YaaT (PSP1 superfamily)
MQTVKIRLRKPRRVFSFLCPDLPLLRDETCVVQSDRGLELGDVILPPEPCPPEMERRFSMRVLRKMSSKDAATQQFLEDEERKARAVCKEKISQRKLPMKLVDAEYTFDKKKIIFYFTAEDRVDFRDLVRDLARDLRTRIELRHIQVRDEAKMVGGIGGCGRELCCTTWLNEFKPISMRMAKKQNLSLNPSKISGQCGRLLCCLAYENDMYEAARKQARQAPEGEALQEPRGDRDRDRPRDDRPREDRPREDRPRDDRPRRDDRGGAQGRPQRAESGDRPRRDDRPNDRPAERSNDARPSQRRDAPRDARPAERPRDQQRPPRAEEPRAPRDEHREPPAAAPQGDTPPPAGGGEQGPRGRNRGRRRRGGGGPGGVAP